MKNICFIDYDMSVRGGVEQVTASLVNALCEKYNIHLISLVENGDLAYNLDSRIKYTVLFDTESRLSEMRKAAKMKLRDYFKENDILVAIIQGNYPGYVTSGVRFKTKTKLVACDHGALMNQWHQKDIVVIRLITSLLCHKVITLTEQSMSDYRQKFKLRKKKLGCIYNWIDLSIPHSEKYDSESKRIISAGRFGKEKGFDMLVKAFAPVTKKHPDWHLDIYGDGEMMDTVKSLVSELNLEQNVHLLGMRSDLAEQYGKYSMYVLPSYREGMPLVLLEAKANRLPIVSFDIMTGPKEIVRDGVDGILVKPYNLDDLGNAICSLIENKDLRVTMSDKSQENIDKFSKETIFGQWCDLIESLS